MVIARSGYFALVLQSSWIMATSPLLISFTLTERDMKFRLKTGRHVQSHLVEDERGNVLKVKETYVAIDSQRCIVPSDDDLVKKFGRQKFEKVPDSTPDHRAQASASPVQTKKTPEDRKPRSESETVPVSRNIRREDRTRPEKPGTPEDPARTTYEAMTVNELREWAAAEEIDLGNATRKDEIIDAIVAATNEG